MPTKRTPSGARVRCRTKPLPSPRLVPLMRLVTALTNATTDNRITWDLDTDQASWQGTDGHVTVAWTLTPKGTVKSAALTVEERSVNIWVDVAMLDNVRVLTPLVRVLIARHQEFVGKIVDGLLADIAGPQVEQLGDVEVARVANSEPYARTMVASSVDDRRRRVPRDVCRVDTTTGIIRESPGIRATIRRWFWRA